MHAGTVDNSPEESSVGFSGALIDDPIFGPDTNKEFTDAKSLSTGVDPPKARLLPEPQEMPAEEYAEHCTTHLKYDKRCEFCLGARRPNEQHQQSTTERKIPILHSDYCFLRDSLSEDTLTVLVMYL